MKDQDRIKLEAELSEAKALPGPVQAYQEIDRLRADLAVARERVRQIEAALPSTYYSDRDPATRVRFMVEQWQRAVTANQQLEAELAEAKANEARLESAYKNMEEAFALANSQRSKLRCECSALRDRLGPVVESLRVLLLWSESMWQHTPYEERCQLNTNPLEEARKQLTRLRAVMGKEKT